MIENLSVLEQELGSLRYRCYAAKREMGVIEIVMIGIVLYFFAFLISALILGFPLNWMKVSREVRMAACGGLALVIDLLACRAIFRHENKPPEEKKDYLCLFEEGFACRIGSKKRQFRFDEIEQIGFGQLLSKLEKKLQPIGYLMYAVKPSLHSIKAEAAKNMITVMLKSGKRIFVRGILIRFNEDQTREFFQILLEEYPELWEPPEAKKVESF